MNKECRNGTSANGCEPGGEAGDRGGVGEWSAIAARGGGAWAHDRQSHTTVAEGIWQVSTQARHRRGRHEERRGTDRRPGEGVGGSPLEAAGAREDHRGSQQEV